MTVDCLRADRLLGYQKNITKNIDELANKGAIFEQAISNGPWTSFSFPSIFTSTLPLMHQVDRTRPFLGINSKTHPKADRVYAVRLANITSIAEVLKRVGYFTGGLHSSAFLSTYYGYGKGFDSFEDILAGEVSGVIKSPVMNRWMRRILNRLCALSGKFCWLRAWQRSYVIRAHVTPYATAESVSEKALSMVKKVSKRKFFLWIHYMDLHLPYLPPIEYLRRPGLESTDWAMEGLKIACKLSHNPRSVTEKELQELLLLYDAEVEYVDSQIGFFLSKLEEIGISVDNTFIILTADHGELLGEHGAFGHGGMLYDELLHVPLIICGPRIKSGIKVSEQVSLLDLAPTVLDLLGFKVPRTFRGTSFVPLVGGKKRKMRKPVISEVLKNGVKMFSCRTESWKYILTIIQNREREELYRLKLDPAETKNVVATERKVRDNLRSYLLEQISMEKDFVEKSRIRARSKKLRPI